MIFWSSRTRYVAGLDGHYLEYGADPKHFQVWYSIANGSSDARRDNAKRIREAFGAGWVLCTSGNRGSPRASPSTRARASSWARRRAGSSG
jgi:hypothetical protein